MPEPLSERINELIGKADELYHRLVLLVAPAGAGKTRALLEAMEGSDAKYVNLSLELSRRLLDMTSRQRSLRVPQLLDEIVGRAGGRAVLLDNLELLFDVTLAQEPLRSLQLLSRRTTVVAAWRGSVEGGYLTYATAGHPEYRRYRVTEEFLIITP